MGSTVRHITIDCAAPHEPYDLALFWSRVLELPLGPDDFPGDPEAAVIAGDGRPMLLFVRVPDAKAGKNRVHLDLEPDTTREEELERVLALGATVVADMRKPNGRGWVVCADPAGNEFCVEASRSDRAAVELREREAAESG
ncbi:VOC family protein [Embleya sp. MST-111070]|uniref:VOC family protein n=1 Tax=Embleya sp. MST-111070 TaxID=3398231 RepID=UPI003F732031